MTKRTVRVWFNHWFSTAYHIINMLKEDDAIRFYVMGTSENKDSVIKLACDEWYKEPSYVNDSQYVNYCLGFCKEHEIEVFVPRRGMTAICKELGRFDEIGTKVLVEKDFDKLIKLNNKEETYKLFEKYYIGEIPIRQVIYTAEEFYEAYREITRSYDRACFKFVEDEGAVSFRVIDNSIETYDGLFKSPGMKVTLKHAMAMMQGKKELPALLVMPYLTGNEVSVDCLRTLQGNIMIPRYKIGGRIAEIRYNDEIIELCNQFYNKIGISGPCNIQFKYHEGIPYLLEVNTRMSGGVQLSCLGAKVNIPNIAVNQLLGIHKDWNLDRGEKRVSYIETPLLLI